MKNILILILAGLYLFTGCVEDSVLSDIEFDDPSLIRPKVEISKIIQNGGTSVEHIYAYLYDRNDDLIRLNNGRVLVNQQDMIIKKEVFTNAKYYSGTEAIGNIKYPKEYKFDVVFSNGDTYDLSITTQNGEFTYLNTENKHSKNDDLRISWNPLPNSVQINMQLLVYYVKDTVNTSKAYEINNIQNSSTGKYVIPSQYFKNHSNTYKANIKLNTIVKGYVNSQFMSGGKIESSNSISKDVEIY